MRPRSSLVEGKSSSASSCSVEWSGSLMAARPDGGDKQRLATTQPPAEEGQAAEAQRVVLHDVPGQVEAGGYAAEGEQFGHKRNEFVDEGRGGRLLVRLVLHPVTDHGHCHDGDYLVH